MQADPAAPLPNPAPQPTPAPQLNPAVGPKRLRFKADAPAWYAFAAGVLLFLLVYGPSTLNPTYDSWIFNGYIGVDILQHYAGWAAFRAGDWAFPLTFTANLHTPFGGAAALADCVPLMAIPAKLLSPLLPATFQYFGWFGLLCMAMGGYAGAKLLGQFPVSGLCRVLGGCLFAFAPVMLERAFQHSALAAHFLVVLALALYFKARRGSFARVPWGFAVLAALAVFTHVYFVPMVLAVAFAAAADGAFTAKKPQALYALLMAVATALLCGGLLGYFDGTQYVPGGYGSFGLNLNAFYNPDSYNWAMWDPSYQNLHWSRFLPGLPVVGDSLGSFSYLGLGVLAALALCAVVYGLRLFKSGWRAAARSISAFIKGHAGLLLACLCLTVFSVSNVVTLNSRVLFSLPLPGWLLRLADTFRSSGRLIWPVYYLLMLCAVLGLCGLFKTRRAASSVGVIGSANGKGAALLQRLAAWLQNRPAYSKAAPLLLAGLLLVQGVDLSPVLRQKHAYFAQPVVPQSYAAPQNWDKIEKPGRVLYQLELNEDRPTALRAALAGMPSNFFLLARGSAAQLQADIETTRESLLNGKLPAQDAAYITSDAELAEALAAALGESCESFAFERYTAFVPRA